MSESEEWVTVAEAARRLDTNEPRLRRLLKLPDFAEAVRQETRQTKTGTRTGTVVSVSVLPTLREALEKGTGSESQHKQEREHSEALSLQQVAAVYQALAAEKEARIRQQEREIEHLRDEVEFLRKQLENRLLPPAHETPPHSSENTPVHREEMREAQRDHQRCAWWQFWKRGR